MSAVKSDTLTWGTYCSPKESRETDDGLILSFPVFLGLERIVIFISREHRSGVYLLRLCHHSNLIYLPF